MEEGPLEGMGLATDHLEVAMVQEDHREVVLVAMAYLAVMGLLEEVMAQEDHQVVVLDRVEETVIAPVTVLLEVLMGRLAEDATLGMGHAVEGL